MLYQATPVCTVMNGGDRAARPALQAGPPTSSSRGALAVCGSRDIVRDRSRVAGATTTSPSLSTSPKAVSGSPSMALASTAAVTLH